MVTRINPTGPANPPGDSPDVTATAKKLAAELDMAMAELSNLDLKTLEPKLIKVAQVFTNLDEVAKQALQAAGK
jgi:hypothetical protein